MSIFSSIFGAKDNPELKSILEKGAFLVDVRTPGEFASGNVKGSVNIPLDSLGRSLDKFKNKERIVVFCRSGGRASQAKSILEQHGFRNVTNAGTWEQVNHLLGR